MVQAKRRIAQKWHGARPHPARLVLFGDLSSCSCVEVAEWVHHQLGYCLGWRWLAVSSIVQIRLVAIVGRFPLMLGALVFLIQLTMLHWAEVSLDQPKLACRDILEAEPPCWNPDHPPGEGHAAGLPDLLEGQLIPYLEAIQSRGEYPPLCSYDG